MEVGRTRSWRVIRLWSSQLISNEILPSLSTMKDLLLIVPDKNTQAALKGALPRYQALGIRQISFDFLVHSGRDGGVRTTGVAMANLKRRQFNHLLLVFDHEGSGAEDQSADQLTDMLLTQLKPTWGDFAQVVVVEPEVDVWMWGSDNLLAEMLKWSENHGIREWLTRQFGFEFDAEGKPSRPKEALERVLWQQDEPRSSSLYEKLAMRISLTKCSDPAFKHLAQTLKNWFGNANVP
jgi:hypothetical protein